MGSPEPLGPAENCCPGSTRTSQPGHLFQVTSFSDTSPSSSGTSHPRLSCIHLPLRHLETQPWALAALSLLQGTAGCRSTSEGRGAMGRHR